MASFVLKVGGEAGWGIETIAKILAKLLQEQGFYVFSSKEYCSQIKGGHNYHSIRFSKKPVLANTETVDFLLALDQQTYDQHLPFVAAKGYILFNDSIKIKKGSQNHLAVPVAQIEKELKEKNLGNAIFLGATTCCLGLSYEILTVQIKDCFAEKLSLKQLLLKAAEKGYHSIKQLVSLETAAPLNLELLDGNSAVVSAALQAKINFHAQYPMTPVSAILHQLAQAAVINKQLIVIQPEDEIAAINMALGASYAGARAMTASSGGGFSLMVEAVGLSSMAEIPLVIVEGQRPGPATGLPTKTEQGDLRFVLSAAQGEFPRVVIAPGDIEEAYTETKRAFYLAEKYQLPVILLVDKYLMESSKTVNLKEEEKKFSFDFSQKINILDAVPEEMLNENGLFKRYQLNNLKRTLPGTERGSYTCAGDEHDEVGYITESPEIRKQMMQRRMNKLNLIEKELPEPDFYGRENFQTLVLSWGSNKGAILEALSRFNQPIGFLHLKHLLPFPTEKVKKYLLKAKQLILVENNYSGQLGDLIREKTGIEIKDKVLRYDGQPFTVDEIYLEIKKRW